MAGEKRGERLARSGRRGDERVAARADREPAPTWGASAPRGGSGTTRGRRVEGIEPGHGSILTAARPRLFPATPRETRERRRRASYSGRAGAPPGLVARTLLFCEVFRSRHRAADNNRRDCRENDFPYSSRSRRVRRGRSPRSSGVQRLVLRGADSSAVVLDGGRSGSAGDTGSEPAASGGRDVRCSSGSGGDFPGRPVVIELDHRACSGRRRARHERSGRVRNRRRRRRRSTRRLGRRARRPRRKRRSRPRLRRAIRQRRAARGRGCRCDGCERFLHESSSASPGVGRDRPRRIPPCRPFRSPTGRCRDRPKPKPGTASAPGPCCSSAASRSPFWASPSCFAAVATRRASRSSTTRRLLEPGLRLPIIRELNKKRRRTTR